VNRNRHRKTKEGGPFLCGKNSYVLGGTYRKNCILRSGKGPRFSERVQKASQTHKQTKGGVGSRGKEGAEFDSQAEIRRTFPNTKESQPLHYRDFEMGTPHCRLRHSAKGRLYSEVGEGLTFLVKNGRVLAGKGRVEIPGGGKVFHSFAGHKGSSDRLLEGEDSHRSYGEGLIYVGISTGEADLLCHQGQSEEKCRAYLTTKGKEGFHVFNSQGGRHLDNSERNQRSMFRKLEKISFCGSDKGPPTLMQQAKEPCVRGEKKPDDTGRGQKGCLTPGKKH